MYLYIYIHTHKERVLHILYCTIIMLKHFNCTAKGEEHFEIHFVWILSFLFVHFVDFFSVVHTFSFWFLSLEPFWCYSVWYFAVVFCICIFFLLPASAQPLPSFTFVAIHNCVCKCACFFSALINCRRIPLSAKYQSNKKKYSKLSFVHYWPQMCVC